jgi:hypothetical protein
MPPGLPARHGGGIDAEALAQGALREPRVHVELGSHLALEETPLQAAAPKVVTYGPEQLRVCRILGFPKR